MTITAKVAWVLRCDEGHDMETVLREAQMRLPYHAVIMELSAWPMAGTRFKMLVEAPNEQ